MLVTIQESSLPEIKARVTLCNHINNRNDETYKDGLMSLRLYIRDYNEEMINFYRQRSILCLLDEKQYLSLDETLVDKLTKLYEKGFMADVVRMLINLCGMDSSKITNEMVEDLDFKRFKKRYMRDYDNDEVFNEESCKRLYEEDKKKRLLGDGEMNHHSSEYTVEEALEGL